MKTIKFKKEMIQAIKEGRKTQTRRPITSEQKVKDPKRNIFIMIPDYDTEIVKIEGTDIVIKITQIHTQKLQDISDSHCKKEGIEPLLSGKGWYNPILPKGAVELGSWCDTPQEAFMRYWDHIYNYKKDLIWKANPLVWVYEFERMN